MKFVSNSNRIVLYKKILEGDFFQKIAHNTEEDYYFWNLCFPDPKNLHPAVTELEQKIIAPIDKFLEE